MILRLHAALTGVALGLFVSSFLQPFFPSAVAASASLSVSRDARIEQDNPDQRFGSDVELKVRSQSGGNYRALVGFDLSAVPAGAFIESATLRLFMNTAAAASRDLQVHRVTNNWNENQVTWNRRTGAYWNTTGGDYDASITAAQSTGTTSGVWLEWNVTAQVQAWVDGSQPNFGFLIRDASEDSSAPYETKFNSREAGSNQPQLLVVWDTTPPSDPTNLTSPSHTPSAWFNDNTVDVTWTAATDNPGGSGLDGYSVEWDTNSTTVPDTVLELQETDTSTTSPAVADGNSHYFHIRTCDNAGNCTSTLHLGPFFIDTTPPNDPLNLTSPSHTPSVWSTDNTVDVTWTAATDNPGGSGVDGYSVEWDTNPTTVPDAVLELQETDTATTSPALADGNSHYFHIRTCDNAGNCTSALHLGPFWIDTSAATPTPTPTNTPAPPPTNTPTPNPTNTPTPTPTNTPTPTPTNPSTPVPSPTATPTPSPTPTSQFTFNSNNTDLIATSPITTSGPTPSPTPGAGILGQVTEDPQEPSNSTSAPSDFSGPVVPQRESFLFLLLLLFIGLGLWGYYSQAEESSARS